MTKPFAALLLCCPLLLGGALSHAATKTAPPAESWQERLAKGGDPKALAAALPNAVAADLPALNAERLRLKAEGKAAAAEAFFAALAKRKPTDAVLLNLGLAYVDQMMGKNLLQQGNLSTRSQEAAEQIIQRDKANWSAWYVRGINNLYWPDWFRKAPLAREYLTEAVAIHERLSPELRDESDYYALGYLALGDAHALLDQPAEARKVWQKGADYYPFVAVLRERLALPDAEQHAKVRAERDADKPIDTDLAFLWAHLNKPFNITLTGGTLYGPGPLTDQPLKPGNLANLYLGSAINGFIPAFNNRAAEPNLPGEILQGKTVDGLLSDGTEANENVDVGFVSLMNGKFNLFLSAVQDGPNKGKINFFLDDGWHWTIRDDIAIDPGFPVGVIKIQEFTFSTSPRVVPVSRQTEAGNPGGTDQSGSLKSGGVVPGALGDANFDGKLDGTLNAIGRFPYDSVLLPGTPFAQTRHFDTNIPVTPTQAALLTTANALSYLKLAMDLQAKDPALAQALRQTYAERMDLARRHAGSSNLPEATKTALNQLKADAAEAGLCAGWNLLRQAAPAAGLKQRDFNASGIKINCAQ